VDDQTLGVVDSQYSLGRLLEYDGKGLAMAATAAVFFVVVALSRREKRPPGGIKIFICRMQKYMRETKLKEETDVARCQYRIVNVGSSNHKRITARTQ
jgi:hypothetical protein